MVGGGDILRRGIWLRLGRKSLNHHVEKDFSFEERSNLM